MGNGAMWITFKAWFQLRGNGDWSLNGPQQQMQNMSSFSLCTQVAQSLVTL